jgi:hypothetical protein
MLFSSRRSWVNPLLQQDSLDTCRTGLFSSAADPDPGSGSGRNNPDNISEGLETIFRVKILKFFDADPGSGMKRIRIWDPGSGNRDPGWKKIGSGIRDNHPGSASLLFRVCTAHIYGLEMDNDEF